MAEASDLKSLKCGFESHHRYFHFIGYIFSHGKITP